MAEKTRRELLEEAFDAAESEDQERGSSGAGEGESASDTRASSEGGADSQGSDTPVGDESGGGVEGGTEEGVAGEAKPERDAKEKAGKSAKSDAETADQKEKKAAEAAQRDAERSATHVTDRPPNSWKPGAREDWGKIPARARAEIGRREQEIQRELSQTAVVRRLSHDLAQIIQPHLPVIQANGQVPLQAIDILLKAQSRLHQGNAEQKARQIAEIMTTYGVDVRVLDKVLSSQPIPPQLLGQGANGQAPPSNAIPSWARPMFDFMTNAQAEKMQREQTLQQNAELEVNSSMERFPFLNDLRLDVADILEQSARRGRVMSLEDAYNRAVALDPEVSQIVAQQKAAARQRGNVGNARRNAASTVRGNPRGGSAATAKGNEKRTRREVLSEAWDDAQ